MNTSYIEIKIPSTNNLHNLLAELLTLDGIQIEKVILAETLMKADGGKPESNYVISIPVTENGYRWPLKSLREIVNRASDENKVTMFDLCINKGDSGTSVEKYIYQF